MGYDIEAYYNIKKATLNITLDEINRIYGNVNNIINKNNEKKPNHFIDENYYGYTINSNNLTTEMIHELNNLNHKVEKDNAIKENDEIHTNNVGDYTWSASFDLGDLAKNYQFDDRGSSKITVDNGKSSVSKAKLTVNLGSVKHQYGTPNLDDYKVGSVEGLTNGDTGNISVEMTQDNALKDNNKHTNDVGDNYTWSGDIESDIAGLKNNYDITVKEGTSSVSKAKLDINVNDVTISQGDKPQYSGQVGELVNGDTLDNVNIHFGVADSTIETVVGEYKDDIGIWIDGKYYDKNQVPTSGVWKNYEISLNPGDLTVLARDWKSWETEDKYTWSKKREERERKAEIHFVDGGQIISEKVTK